MKNKPKKTFKTMQEFFANKDRWCKGSLDEKGKKCLIGAMIDIYGSPCGAHNVRLRKAISDKEQIFMREVSLIGFNDDPKTTIKDIRSVCKAANV